MTGDGRRATGEGTKSGGRAITTRDPHTRLVLLHSKVLATPCIPAHFTAHPGSAEIQPQLALKWFDKAIAATEKTLEKLTTSALGGSMSGKLSPEQEKEYEKQKLDLECTKLGMSHILFLKGIGVDHLHFALRT